MKILLLLMLAFFAQSTPQAWAYQQGRTVRDHAQVHQEPNAMSQTIGELAEGTEVPVSSEMVRDSGGVYWYKTKLPAGETGYIQATDIGASSLVKGLHDAGVGSEATGKTGVGWPSILMIRGMGLGGTELNGGTLDFGGEAEASLSLLMPAHGWLHRFISLGAAYMYFKGGNVVAGSLIVRFFAETRVEPVIRIRVGEFAKTNDLAVGGNLGIEYPFSLNPKFHLSGHFETGTITAMDESVLHVWGAAGLGIHF